MTTWNPDEQSALDEFAEEGDAPRAAWSRAAFAGALNPPPAQASAEDTPIVWVIPPDHGVSWWRWIAAAAAVAACLAIVVAIVMRARVESPAQSSNSLSARPVEFASIALPEAPFQVTPAIPLPTFDQSVSVAAPSRVAVAAAPTPASMPTAASLPTPTPLPAPAPAPALPQPIVKQEIKPVETLAATPPPPPSTPAIPAAASPALPAPARTETAARIPEPAAPALSVTERDEREIRGVLDAYRDSYEKLDVNSTARLWPGVDKAALSRAFGTLARQEIDFAECSLDVAGQHAKARCVGSLQYVRRVGNGSPQTRSLLWEVELDRSSGQWLIDRMSAQ